MEKENNHVEKSWEMNLNPMDIVLMFILTFLTIGYVLWLFGAI